MMMKPILSCIFQLLTVLFFLFAEALFGMNVGSVSLMEETIRRTLKDASDKEGGRRRRMSSEIREEKILKRIRVHPNEVENIENIDN